MRCRIAKRNNQKTPKAPLKYNKERLGKNEVKQCANKLVQGRREKKWSKLDGATSNCYKYSR